MMTTACAPIGAAGRPVRDAQSPMASIGSILPRAKSRPVRIALATGICLALQGVSAGPAAVATLSHASIERAPLVRPMIEPAAFAPALSDSPRVLASILNVAFPVTISLEERMSPAFVPKSAYFGLLGSEAHETTAEAAAPPESPYDMMAFGSRTAPRWLVNSVLRAAHVAGVDPVYLMALADVESSLSPDAKAQTSSAEGLFQFIDRTWLETVAAHAGDYGFPAVAKAITFVEGEPTVSDEKAKAWVLGMRRDPYFSALMACELIKDIQRALQSDGERELSEAELYIAHFLGAGSAARFLRALDEKPDVAASKLFPQAAKANLNLFTEKAGRKRRAVTVAEFYQRIDTKITRRLSRFDDLAPGLPPLTSGQVVAATAAVP
jgi:hypothetical protein